MLPAAVRLAHSGCLGWDTDDNAELAVRAAETVTPDSDPVVSPPAAGGLCDGLWSRPRAGGPRCGPGTRAHARGGGHAAKGALSGWHSAAASAERGPPGEGARASTARPSVSLWPQPTLRHRGPLTLSRREVASAHGAGDPGHRGPSGTSSCRASDSTGRGPGRPGRVGRSPVPSSASGRAAACTVSVWNNFQRAHE